MVVREPVDGKIITFERNPDGSVRSSEKASDRSLWKRMRQSAVNLLVPENVSESVSKDYVRSRQWQLCRDFLGAFGGMASLAAVMTAVGPANIALATLSIASLSVANVTWLKERLGQVSSIASTKIARIAEKNPKPWMLAADVINNVGTITDAATAIVSPLAYYPMQIGMMILRSGAGAAAGAAGANVGPRQAIRGNLGEVSVKNSNQSTIATFAGATIGAATLAALSEWWGFGPAAMIVASVGATAGLGAYAMMLRSLSYSPVNERAMRQVISHGLDHQGEVPAPPSLTKQLFGLTHSDKLIVGNRVRPLLEDPSFNDLRTLYQHRPYIMAIRNGAPYIVMKRDKGADDRPPEADKPLPDGADYVDKMAQVQAASQAIIAERLLASDEYEQRATKDGTPAATRWVIEESLHRSPDDVRPLLREMQRKGWSVDMIRFWGEERPVQIANADAQPAVAAAA